MILGRKQYFPVKFLYNGGSEKAVETMADQLSTHTEMSFNYIQNRKQMKSECLQIAL